MSNLHNPKLLKSTNNLKLDLFLNETVVSAAFAFHQQLGQFALASLNHTVAVPMPGVDSEQHRATFREGGRLVQNLS